MNSERSSDPNFQYSRWLSSPEPGEEVVISGISGRLPESRTVHEFRDNLFAKKEMISDDDRRWTLDHPDLPKRSAKIFDIDRFDAGYFGVHYRQADVMDPMMRLFMETAVEAIMDAGVNPEELAGSRTGVFMSTCWSEIDNETLCKIAAKQRFVMTGYLKSFIPQRVSYYLKLKGPACNIDTACSSSMNAFDNAFKAIRSGQCDNALVGCGNLMHHPATTINLFRMGLLSPEGMCKVFDQDANGYVRGEAIACILLQKARNARRVYAQIVNTKVNCDGYKEQGITFPMAVSQAQLMTEIYEESKISPSEISFLEVHGTGTAAGDPQEVDAVDRALARTSNKQLLVGAVKSSIAHSEPSSGICAIIKVIIAMETGFIAPNINLKRIKEGMDGFKQGRMKVVTELTPLQGDDAIIGINNFGFGGNNAHTILRRFQKTKTPGSLGNEDIPRLLCVSGRSEESVLKLLDDVARQDFDPEYLGLLHQVYKTNISSNLYRGFVIVSKVGVRSSSVKFTGGHQVPLHVVFGDITKSYKVLGSYLLRFPVFRDTIARIHKVLVQFKINNFETTFNLGEFLGSLWVQVGLADVLKNLGLSPCGVYGISRCGPILDYYQDVVTLEEAVLKVLESNQEVDEKNMLDVQYREVLSRSSRRGVVLNISDKRLMDGDLLPVENDTVMFLEILGRLYEMGHNPQIHNLYPKITFPVSRATPMISPSLKWDHKKSWYTYRFSEFTSSTIDQREFSLSYLHDEFKFLEGYVINDRNLLPATEYLFLVWQTVAQSRRLLVTDVPVIFEDCKFVKAVIMPKSGYLKLLVTIQKGSGNFEIMEKNCVVMSGRVLTNVDVGRQLTNLVEKESEMVLEQEEIYKELYIRGYEYDGEFKAIERCDLEGSSGLITWKDNWSCFMENMLQLKIFQNDTRLLYVPVGIKRVIIDPARHLDMVHQRESEGWLPVHVYKDCDIIKSGGIEIYGLQTKSVTKRRPRLDPVLETYSFVPNRASLEFPEAVRVNIQVILENALCGTFKAVEILDDSADPDSRLILPLVDKILIDTPSVAADLTISSKHGTQADGSVKVADVALTAASNLHLVIGTKILQQVQRAQTVLPSLNKYGFVLTREDLNFRPEVLNGIEIITEYETSEERLILFRRSDRSVDTKAIEVSSKDFAWIAQLKQSLKNDSSVIVFSESHDSGILGFVTCIRREPGGQKVKCFCMMDTAPPFDLNNEFYCKQLQKNMAINIYKNNTWGTYRHLSIEKLPLIVSENYFANVTTRGNLSSLKWLEGPHTHLEENQTQITVYYSGINFKDILIASGHVSLEVMTTNRLEQECPIGLEFSGRDPAGRRVTGITGSRAFSSHLAADRGLLWTIPDSWSLEDAATVPVSYSTVLYALFLIGDLKPESSILVHSATGGIGLAALNICLHHKCDTYVTVGSEEKRQYLRNNYPHIPESHIGNSRDTSFEDIVRTGTEGRGVDFILNSLSGDKLEASIRCLARGGKLIEIGKFDLAKDISLQLLLMDKEASYHGIMLDDIVTAGEEFKAGITKMIRDGINDGYVKPLPRIVFDKEQIGDSYRYMMEGKHLGKVLIKLRTEEKREDAIGTKEIFAVTPRFNCDSRCCYVIVGGLGGVGLELADWLVLRGAKQLVLVSRVGISNGYQLQRICTWESYGVVVQVVTTDVASVEGCTDLITEAAMLGPIDGIFNLAVVLKDALFEDQTEENFVVCLKPKAYATKCLDQVTRKLCPQLRYFVVFSSGTCGRGNAGQCNYGQASSIIERICEKRKSDGFAALAIQFGAIGDVGIFVKIQKQVKGGVVTGTVQQPISSCLEVLDILLKQDHPVVASMMVAEKCKSDSHSSPVEAVASTLGIKDLKTVSQHVTLPELGSDSMTATEIINMLENEFEIYVTVKEMRSLTFAKLAEIAAEADCVEEGKEVDEIVDDQKQPELEKST